MGAAPWRARPVMWTCLRRWAPAGRSRQRLEEAIEIGTDLRCGRGSGDGGRLLHGGPDAPRDEHQRETQRQIPGPERTVRQSTEVNREHLSLGECGPLEHEQRLTAVAR